METTNQTETVSQQNNTILPEIKETLPSQGKNVSFTKECEKECSKDCQTKGMHEFPLDLLKKLVQPKSSSFEEDDKEDNVVLYQRNLRELLRAHSSLVRSHEKLVNLISDELEEDTEEDEEEDDDTTEKDDTDSD